MKSNDLSKFAFTDIGHNDYMVTYTTGRGDFYEGIIHDMELIEVTKNATIAKIKYIIKLRDNVKRVGIHYHSNGKPFYKFKTI